MCASSAGCTHMATQGRPTWKALPELGRHQFPCCMFLEPEAVGNRRGQHWADTSLVKHSDTHMSLHSRPVLTGTAPSGKQRFSKIYPPLGSHSTPSCFCTFSQHSSSWRACSQPVSPLSSTLVKNMSCWNLSHSLLRTSPKSRALFELFGVVPNCPPENTT